MFCKVSLFRTSICTLFSMRKFKLEFHAWKTRHKFGPAADAHFCTLVSKSGIQACPRCFKGQTIALTRMVPDKYCSFGIVTSKLKLQLSPCPPTQTFIHEPMCILFFFRFNSMFYVHYEFIIMFNMFTVGFWAMNEYENTTEESINTVNVYDMYCTNDFL